MSDRKIIAENRKLVFFYNLRDFFNLYESIIFDNSHPLALAPDVEWAVVTEPYAVFRESDEWGGSTAGHCRKGEILQVKGKSVDAQKENWYYFEGGWLPQSCVSIFSNRYKAETVSKGLLSSEN